MEFVDIMKLRMVVYMALNTITGKVYIGKTAGLLGKRIRDHRYDSKEKSGYFQRSIRKHGWDAFEWSVLEHGCESEEELNDLECHYIFQHKHYGRGVYNCTLGGEGCCGMVHSEESKKKISEAGTGEKNNMFGRTGEKNPNFGNTGEKSYMFGKHLSEETQRKISETKCKFTYKITRPDGTIDIVTNLKEYCKQNNIDSGGMYHVASGKYKAHKGFRVEKIENIPVQEQPQQPIYDHNTPLMQVFLGRKSLGVFWNLFYRFQDL